MFPKNRGTPKWMVYNGKPYRWFGPTPIFGNTQRGNGWVFKNPFFIPATSRARRLSDLPLFLLMVDLLSAVSVEDSWAFKKNVEDLGRWENSFPVTKNEMFFSRVFHAISENDNPEIQHGTWKSPLEKDSCSKPSFSGSMLNFGDVMIWQL